MQTTNFTQPHGIRRSLLHSCNTRAWNDVYFIYEIVLRMLTSINGTCHFHIQCWNVYVVHSWHWDEQSSSRTVSFDLLTSCIRFVKLFSLWSFRWESACVSFDLPSKWLRLQRGREKNRRYFPITFISISISSDLGFVHNM